MRRLGAHVTALDISPGRLELLRARVPDVEAMVGDVTDLPFPDDAFDATVCFGGPLSYGLDRSEDALAELVRVTRGGGLVLVSVMMYRWSELEALLARHGEVVAAAAAGLLPDPRPEEPELRELVQRIEAELCEEPGAVSCGQHIVAALRVS